MTKKKLINQFNNVYVNKFIAILDDDNKTVHLYDKNDTEFQNILRKREEIKLQHYDIDPYEEEDWEEN